MERFLSAVAGRATITFNFKLNSSPGEAERASEDKFKGIVPSFLPGSTRQGDLWTFAGVARRHSRARIRDF